MPDDGINVYSFKKLNPFTGEVMASFTVRDAYQHGDITHDSGEGLWIGEHTENFNNL